MSSGFNGSGTFTISEIGVPYVSGQPILALPANNINSAIATGLSTCILKDGTQASVSANIPFNNFKLTYVGAGTAFNDAANVYNLQLSTGTLLTVTGTDTLTGNATPTLTSGYATGMTFRFFAAANNTGAVTINIDGLGAKSITRNGSSALGAGDIYTGNLITITYNGTAFVLQNAVTYNASGNVGIGTSSPYAPLSFANIVGRKIDLYYGGVGNEFSIGVQSSELRIATGTTPAIISFYTGGYSGTEQMRLDSSGNLGLGVTPSAWATTYKALQVGGGGTVSGSSTQINFSNNWVGTSTGDKYIANGYASAYTQVSGQHQWYTAPSGTAGNTISFTQAMTLDASGNLGVGTTSPSTYGKLAVQTSGGAVNGLGIYSPSTTNGAKIVLFDNYSNAGISSVPVSATSSSDLSFIAGGAEKMRLDSSGNLKFNSGYGSVATAYGCRAWVNFNGTGAVSKRQSGNVSSITDNAAGDYTVNFTTAMPDTDYGVAFGTSPGNGRIPYIKTVSFNDTAGSAATLMSTTQLTVIMSDSGGSYQDCSFYCVSIFR